MLVEDCSKVRIEDFLRSCRGKLKKLILNSEIEASGYHIKLTTSRTHYNGIRIWFECPLCNKRVGVLFKHPFDGRVGCRQCLNLEYKKRRYKGMIENNLPDS